MTQHDTRTDAQARSATRVSQRRTWAAPDVALRQHPNAVSGPPRPVSSASPVPYRACNAPALFRGPQEPRNKKSTRIATFLRLGIVAWRQNAIRSPKTQKKRLFSGPEEQRGVRNRKKVAKIPSFLFLQWVQPPQRGKSREKRGTSWPATQNQKKRKAPAMRTPPEKPIWPESLKSTLP